MNEMSFRILYFVLALYLFTGCNPDVKMQLEEAKVLLEENPDSAYLYLQSVERPERYKETDYAMWCLLMAQAIDKSYREHISDSLIHVAVRYFSKQPDSSLFATALYTQGCVEKELGKNEEAVQSFMKALDIAKEENDYKLQYEAAVQLGHLYVYMGLSDKAFISYKQALHFAKLSGDSISTAYAYAYLGRGYGIWKDWNKAIDAYNQSVIISEQISSIPALRLGLGELATIYNHAGRFQKSFDCLKRVLALPDDSLLDSREITYLHIGDLLRLMGRCDSAASYLENNQDAMNIYTRRDLYQCFYYLYEKRQNYIKSVAYNNLYWQCNDSIRKMERKKAIAEVERKYNNEKLITEKQHFQLKVYAGAVVALLALLGITLGYAHKKRILVRLYKELEDIKGQIAENEKRTSYYQQEIARLSVEASDKEQILQNKRELESEIQSLSLRNQELKQQAKIFVRLNKYQEEIVRYKKLEERKELYPNILTRIEKNRSMDEAEWEEVFVMVDAIHNRFTKRLKTNYPSLNNKELIIFCLLKLGYGRKDISEILDVSEEALQKRIQRSKAHFPDHSKWKKGEFEQFIKSF